MEQTKSSLEEESPNIRQQWRQDLIEQQQERQQIPQQQQQQQTQHPGTRLETQSNSATNTPDRRRSPITTLNQRAKQTENESVENKAKSLFLTGVSLERQGKMPEAVCYYRQAIQLQPDIESNITDFNELNPQSESNEDEIDNNLYVDDDEVNDDDFEYMTNISEELLDVVEKFDKMSTKGICEPKFPTTKIHISVLPAEVIMYIFKWVVSTTLDLRSLEQLARVCKGFYALARDPEIWRLACIRIWGRNVGSPILWDSCWRKMFLERTRLLYNGVYISKISYVRPSEPTFQMTYTPYQLIIYYRYLRFFMDGTVLFYTSPEEPQSSIYRLSQKSENQPSIWRGNFTLIGSNVTIMAQRNDHTGNTGRRRGQRNVQQNIERFFHMDLQVQNTKKKRNNRLAWKQYSCQTFHRSTGQTSVSQFDLNNQFTSFYFSRVRSFEPVSSTPLGLGEQV